MVEILEIGEQGKIIWLIWQHFVFFMFYGVNKLEQWEGRTVPCLKPNAKTSIKKALLFRAPPTEKGETWALLVAGSNGWYNYRHQVTFSQNLDTYPPFRQMSPILIRFWRNTASLRIGSSWWCMTTSPITGRTHSGGNCSTGRMEKMSMPGSRLTTRWEPDYLTRNCKK